MKGPIPFREIARLIVPSESAPEKVGLPVLAGYFDDSGTHENASVVVWAGFLAPVPLWEDFDGAWRELLKKWGITAFHMSPCQQHDGEFDRWKDADSDHAIYEFREAIISHELFGIAAGISIADWEAAFPSHMTPEQFCVAICLRDSILQCKKWTPNNELAVILDKRKFDSDVLRGIAHYYEEVAAGDPEIVSITFQQMKSFTGLQAADMLAWEYYNFCREWVASGGTARPRPHFHRFVERRFIKPTMYHSAAIKTLAKQIEQIGGLPPSATQGPPRRLPNVWPKSGGGA